MSADQIVFWSLVATLAGFLLWWACGEIRISLVRRQRRRRIAAAKLEYDLRRMAELAKTLTRLRRMADNPKITVYLDGKHLATAVAAGAKKNDRRG